jgi:hypothetical protein
MHREQLVDDHDDDRHGHVARLIVERSGVG